MLSFVIIGLVCNSLGCYWVTADTTEFSDQSLCYAIAADLKG
jgi:hypothetical protein